MDSLKRALRRIFLPLPEGIRKNFSSPGGDGLRAVEAALRSHYFSGFPPGYLDTEAGRKDWQDHLRLRLQGTREIIIPWLASVRPLAGARILEIGCGTGSSTVPLAEQGALVTAVDIDEGSLRVAEARARAYGQTARFLCANAQAAGELGQGWDLVIFFACLEHMTYAERLAALAGHWRALSSGACLVVIETPNRLWYHDSHTWSLPFIDWLPDELAYDYSSRSQRPHLNALYRSTDQPKRLEDFYRKGRGASFHEFELALGSLQGIPVAGRLHAFHRRKNPHLGLKWRFSRGRRYQQFLRRACPGIDPCFFEEYLDFALRKP